jgi:hypothetical protein
MMTLKTLGDVRKLIGHIPKERRELQRGSMSKRRYRNVRPVRIREHQRSAAPRTAGRARAIYGK